MQRARADNVLYELGLVDSVEFARSLIMEGRVICDGTTIKKPGDMVGLSAEFHIKPDDVPFVSRGGLKLFKACSIFPITLAGRVCADLGASTGGFTDCMLQQGAKKVYAIDVGYGQLDWKLRNDARVVVMERTNARFIDCSWFDMPPEFASLDLSFISVKLILPALFGCLTDDGQAVVLVKPQFEAPRGSTGKNGVIRDYDVHVNTLLDVAEFAIRTGYGIVGMDFSPITGPKGNIEFLLALDKSGKRLTGEELIQSVKETVKHSHEQHNKA